MALVTLDEFNSKSANPISSTQIKGFSVHSDLIAGTLTNKTEEKIGTVSNVLVNDAGQIQYIVVDLGNSPSGREVMLPAERARVDADHQCVYASALTKEDAEQLPTFDTQMRSL
ncbi:MAG: PRC-barrel domain containing protein [Cyanobacteria bacterium RM1_2_2]|nr:PRC-barrel domain containing protein [Cyanobacteria bacterium RM1_2_2]